LQGQGGGHAGHSHKAVFWKIGAQAPTLLPPS